MLTDLDVAHRLATIAGSVALPFFRGENRTWSKSDGSPIGEADLAVDAALAAELAQLRPQDGVLSEESPELIGSSGRRWILIPLMARINSTPASRTGAKSRWRSMAASFSGWSRDRS